MSTRSSRLTCTLLLLVAGCPLLAAAQPPAAPAPVPTTAPTTAPTATPAPAPPPAASPQASAPPSARDIRLAFATANERMRSYPKATDPAVQAGLVKAALQDLRPALTDPLQEQLDAWRLAAVLAPMLENQTLAAFAFEAIDRLKPDWDTDEIYTTIMGRLNVLGAKEAKQSAQAKREAVLNALRPLNAASPAAHALRAKWLDTVLGSQQTLGTLLTTPLAPGVEVTSAWIPAGVFTMGSPASEAQRDNDEGPQHQVRISKGFWMMTTEVQQGQWQAVMGSTKNPNPSYFKQSGPTYPVERVSWYDAVEFANKLTEAVAKKNPQMNLKPYYTIAVSKRGENDQIEEAEVRINAEARGYRLPTEAEWEYACRAGTTGPFHFGQTISTNQANYDGNLVYGAGDKGEYRQRTTPTAFFGAAGRNAFGLYDMHGNVWEWCWDWYDAEWYKGGDRTDPIGPQTGGNRVLRGGSWIYYPWSLRSANRDWIRPPHRNSDVGFRLCLDSE